jgi:hypothetical protein
MHFLRNLVLQQREQPFVILQQSRFFAGMGALPTAGHTSRGATSNGPINFNNLPSGQLATSLQRICSGNAVR